MLTAERSPWATATATLSVPSPMIVTFVPPEEPLELLEPDEFEDPAPPPVGFAKLPPGVVFTVCPLVSEGVPSPREISPKLKGEQETRERDRRSIDRIKTIEPKRM